MDAILSLFVFLLISLSITDLWTSSYIFSRLRNWISRLPYSKVLICAECFSFWVGVFLSIVFDPLIGYSGLGHYYLSNIFCGALSFLISRLLYSKGIL